MKAAAAPEDPRPGAAFAAYLATGAGRSGLWRAIPTLLLVGLAWVGSTVALLAGALLVAGDGPMARDLEALLGQGGPGGVALALATFSGIWAGFALALPLLHGRRFASLLGRGGVLGLGEFGRGALLGLAFYALTALGALLVADPPSRTALPFDTWTAWLSVLAVLIFVQAGGEELIFRGYLAQEIGRRLAHPIAWAVVPSAIFGALHYAPDLPPPAGVLYVAVTFLFGLSAAVLVWRTGRLGAAIGLHVALNFAGLGLAGLDGVITGSQLWVFALEDAIPLFVVDLVTSAGLLALLLSPVGARLFPRR